MEPTKDETITLMNLKDGALVELFDQKLQEIMSNIQDPNTPATAIREIHLKVVFKPDEDRYLTKYRIACMTKLPGAKALDGACVMGAGKGGAFEAREIVPRQQELFQSDKVTPISAAKKGGTE